MTSATAPAPLDRDDDDPRRAAGRAPAPAAAARSHRPHPHAHQPRRAPHPQHRRRGRAPHPAHARRTARCSSPPVPRSWSSPRCCSSPPTPARRSVATPACSRSSATSACSPARCSCSGSSPPSPGTGRHDARPLSVDISTALDAGPTSPLRHRGRPASGTSATPATSCGWSLWALGRCSARAVRRAGDPTSAGVSADLGRAGDRGARRGCASCCSRSRRSSRSPFPVRRGGRARRPAAVAAARRRRARRGRGRRRCSRCSTSLFDIGGPRPGAVTDGTWVASTDFPSLDLRRRCRRGRDRRQAVAARGRGGARADLSAAGARASCWRSPGAPGFPSCCSRSRAGVTAGAAVLVAFGAPNRRPRRRWSRPRSRDGGLAVAELVARAGRRRAGAALHRDARRR